MPTYLFYGGGIVVVLDKLRTLMRIRKPRRPLPPGPQPTLGSNIVNGRMRMRLKYPITPEQWQWLTLMGWRTVDMRQNRRRYYLVEDRSVLQLVSAETTEERVEIHARIMKIADEKAEERRALVEG